MGDPQKMVLQYEWTETVKAPDIVGCNQRLTNMLRRLIHIATTEFIDLSKSRPQPVRFEIRILLLIVISISVYFIYSNYVFTISHVDTTFNSDLFLFFSPEIVDNISVKLT